MSAPSTSSHEASVPAPVGQAQLPGAWYDLTCRIDSARAVASCALESLPCGLQGVEYERINHTSFLIAAMQDLLKLMVADVNVIEKALQA